MSTFEVLVEKIDDITNHPDADRLSIVKIRGYNCISAKLPDGSHSYNVGDLCVYVPEASIVPNYILKNGFWDDDKNKGILAGSNGNRVKAIKLRGIVSQGILLRVTNNTISNETTSLVVKHGDNVAEHLGIVKYEPAIPTFLAGQVASKSEFMFNYDFENIKKYPDTFNVDDVISITEKLHGTHIRIIITNNEIMTTSKGQGSKGLVLKNNEENANNVYVKILNQYMDTFKQIQYDYFQTYGEFKLYIFGEVIGGSIQDLSYGFKEPVLKVFDVFHEDYYNDIDFGYFIKKYELPIVPLLYQGVYSENIVNDLTSGKTFYNGVNIREGVVVKTLFHPRKILKSVSNDYLLRKGNVTEYN